MYGPFTIVSINCSDESYETNIVHERIQLWKKKLTKLGNVSDNLSTLVDTRAHAHSDGALIFSYISTGNSKSLYMPYEKNRKNAYTRDF
mgnify:CR=1 FL=1